MTEASHIPLRTCVLCREIISQRELWRVAVVAGRPALDVARRHQGRGAYIHPDLRCRPNDRSEDAKLASALSRAFRRGVSPADAGILRASLLGASACDRDSVERKPQSKAKDDTGSRSEDARL